MRTFEIMPRDPSAKGLNFQSSIYEPIGNGHNLICEVYLTEEAEYIKQALNGYDPLVKAAQSDIYAFDRIVAIANEIRDGLISEKSGLDLILDFASDPSTRAAIAKARS